MSSEISLVMMVKDEEDNLPRLLKSVEGSYDELVAVDTGSRDKTVDILNRAGARIIHSPWQRNFALHRNEGIKEATKGWILILDADEEIDRLSKPHIRKAVEDAKDIYNSAWFTVRSFTVMGNYSQASGIRLFRNGLGFYYKNRLHNQLFMDKTASMTTPIVIWHYGYAISPDEMIKKYKYRLEMLKEDLKERPEDPTLWHHAAVTHRAARELEAAVFASQQALSLAKNNKDYSIEKFSWTRFIGAICLAFLNKVDEAKEECLKGIADDPKNMDFYYLLCKIEYDRGNFDKAIVFGRSYLGLHKELSDKIAGKDFHFDTMNLEVHIYSMVQDSLMRSGGFNGLLMEITNGIGQNEINC